VVGNPGLNPRCFFKYLFLNIFYLRALKRSYLPAGFNPAKLNFFLAIALLLMAQAAFADDALWQKLKSGGYVILIRHAETDPGVGDPPGFRLNDCKTQRNLNDAGREQAKRLGAAFAKRGIPVAKVMTSRWCRALDTARIAFGGAQPWPALDNTFETPQRREPQMSEIRTALAKPVAGGNLVLVTHGVNIHALSGISPGTAEPVVMLPGARPATLGRLALP
jgi:broad specificity phosphatase PhoE